MSKGSNRRPSAVPSSVVDERWEMIFGRRNAIEKQFIAQAMAAVDAKVAELGEKYTREWYGVEETIPALAANGQRPRLFNGMRWSKTQPWPEGEPLPDEAFVEADFERTGPNSGIVHVFRRSVPVKGLRGVEGRP